MIDPAMAQGFIDRFYKQLKIHLNIMNEKGIIVASSRPERIGHFHSCAYEIIQKQLPVMITSELTQDLIGVTCPGVNLLLTDGRQPIGVIGVSGNPEEVLNVARTIKIAFESQMQYETQRRDEWHADADTNRLANALLFEPSPNLIRLVGLAESLGFKDHMPRMLIKIRIDNDAGARRWMPRIQGRYPHLPICHDQDLLLQLDPASILLCKAIPVLTDGTINRREYINGCLAQLDSLFSRAPDDKMGEIDKKDIVYICGTTVEIFQDYREAFNLINWVEGVGLDRQYRIYHVTDYWVQYAVDLLKDNKSRPIFNHYAHLVDRYPGKDHFLVTVGAMIDTGISIDAAATRLFVHKNTVVIRMKKIRETLGMNPIQHLQDTLLLIGLHHYMKKN